MTDDVPVVAHHRDLDVVVERSDTMIAISEAINRRGGLGRWRDIWHGRQVTLYKSIKTARAFGQPPGGEPIVVSYDWRYLPVVYEPYASDPDATRLRWLDRVTKLIRADPAVTFELAEREMQAWGRIADRLYREPPDKLRLL